MILLNIRHFTEMSTRIASGGCLLRQSSCGDATSGNEQRKPKTHLIAHIPTLGPGFALLAAACVCKILSVPSDRLSEPSCASGKSD